ncbi:hypothetical protein [Methylopila sp. M107]|uniref:hypothetical protein n=1 Tax=Methylopila sp. M107 TaxID=1101190 RepID=UPI00037EB2FB|nr:hypothetical protein [Methylopila sp. M107]
MARPPSFSTDGDPSAGVWDAEIADQLIGKYALVGVMWTDASGDRREQYHGRIVSADPAKGIEIACEGFYKGETFVLPPSTDSLGTAQPGEYRLRATGETVINPDVLSTWRIEAPTETPS